MTVPVYQYTPIYWSTTDIARQNGYDDTIEFAVEATWQPLSVPLDNPTYTNAVAQSIGGRYSTDNGTNWTNFTVVGSIGSTTLTYNGTPLQASDTPKTDNVLIELTANDSLSSSTLSLTVPKGIPLIQIEDGKITINGDVEINGNLVVNGTITQNTGITATLTGTGSDSYCYVYLASDSSTKYYGAGTLTVPSGDTLVCYVNNMTKRVRVNGTNQTLTNNAYEYTPSGNFTVTFSFTIADHSYIDITT